MNLSEMSASHLIFIPAVLLIGIVIGWVLGSRAAADAFAAQQRKELARRTSRAQTHPGSAASPEPHRDERPGSDAPPVSRRGTG
jgi:hypothetical protein